jgi:hypothetical protein
MLSFPKLISGILLQDMLLQSKQILDKKWYFVAAGVFTYSCVVWGQALTDFLFQIDIA